MIATSQNVCDVSCRELPCALICFQDYIDAKPFSELGHFRDAHGSKGVSEHRKDYPRQNAYFVRQLQRQRFKAKQDLRASRASYSRTSSRWAFGGGLDTYSRGDLAVTLYLCSVLVQTNKLEVPMLELESGRK